MAALPLAAPSVLIKPHQTLAQATTDELGRLQAQIAPLKNKEEALKQLLRDSGLEVIEGDLYRATITQAKPTVAVDWEAALRSICSEERLTKLSAEFSTVKSGGAARIAVKARKGV